MEEAKVATKAHEYSIA